MSSSREWLSHGGHAQTHLQEVMKFEGWVLISIGRVFIFLALLEMKRKINNCTSIDKYKLTEPFHQKNAKDKYCSFKFLQF